MNPPLLVTAILCLALGSCGSPGNEAGADEIPVMAFDTTVVRVATRADTVPVRVEIAASPEQRTMGLMERTSLAPDAGMLFLYDEVQPADASFWMFRTRIPLEIAFLGEDGTIRAIRDMVPCDSPVASFCPTYGAGVEFSAALEVNAGFASRTGMRVGDRVITDLLPGAAAPDTAPAP